MKQVFKERFIAMVEALQATDADLTKAEIARRMGVTAQVFSNHMGPNRPVPQKFIEKFIDTFRLNIDYYLTGKGSPLTKNVYDDVGVESKRINKIKETPRRTMPNATLLGDMYETEFEDGAKFRQVGNTMWAMNVPLVTEKAKAGWLSGFADSNPAEDLELYNIEVLVDFVAKGRYLAFEITGDSMDDGTIKSIPNKAIVVGRELPMHQWKPRLYNNEYPNWVFVHRRDGIICKQISDQDIENGWVVHHSLNPDKTLYPDERIELKEVYKIYNVVKRILP